MRNEGSYYAYINLRIGDLDIETDSKNFGIMSMSHTRISSDASQIAVFNIYDDTALLVDNEIAKGNMELEFSYGYSSGESSKTYRGTVARYTPSFTSAGVELKIEAVAPASISLTKTGIKDYSGLRIHEIVESICKEEGWKVGTIVECEPVYENPEKGLKRENEKNFLRENQASRVFIEEKLVPLAKAERTGEGDFTFFLEDSGESGQTASFRPKNWGEDPSKDFDFVIGEDSETIISFEPRFDSVLMSLKGSNQVDIVSVDPYTNEEVKVSVGSEDKAVSGNRTYDTGIRRVTGVSSSSEDELVKMANNLHSKAKNLAYPATLLIKGDPTIEPLEVISIVVLTRDGLLHHSSGAYIIISAEDTIENGIFCTKLELIRNGASLGRDDIGGLDVNDPNFTSAPSSPANTSINDSKTVNGSLVPSDVPENQFLKASTPYLGIPYKYGGNSLSGLDCSGFVQKVYSDLGVNLPRTSSEQSKVGTDVPRNGNSCSGWQPGDLLFWKDKGSDKPASHVAIYLGNGYMAHAPKTGDVVKICRVYYDNNNRSLFVKRPIS